MRGAQGALDPRDIITPDAFEVSRDLLGVPLARPARRGIATLIDLAVVGLITVVTRDVGAIVGVLVALVFVRMALRSPITKDLPPPLAMAFRFSVGCLGFVILIISLVAIWWLRSAPDLDDILETATGELAVSGVGELDVDGVPGLQDLISGTQGGLRLRGAESAEDAEDAAYAAALSGLDVGFDADEIAELLAQFVPDDGEWVEDADDIIERAIDRARAGAGARQASGDDVARGPRDTLSPRAALIEYARLLQAEDEGLAEAGDDLRRLALLEVATDTLRRLESQLGDAERDRSRTQSALETSEARVAELEEGSGLMRLTRQLIDQLGLAFGWGSIYFAVLLPWWKGQTVGKRLLGVRVLRLNGEPINWWFAFERTGGYAAGFATGLLGFAQVYWDPNRQGIHDKIAGTVVVREGVPKVETWT